MPVFHTFTAGGKRYMFDANTNVIINLKEDLYFELEKYMQSGYKEITPAIEKLRDRGYLKIEQILNGASDGFYIGIFFGALYRYNCVTSHTGVQFAL